MNLDPGQLNLRPIAHSNDISVVVVGSRRPHLGNDLVTRTATTGAEFESPQVSATIEWARGDCTANFSLGGPIIR